MRTAQPVAPEETNEGAKCNQGQAKTGVPGAGRCNRPEPEKHGGARKGATGAINSKELGSSTREIFDADIIGP